MLLNIKVKRLRNYSDIESLMVVNAGQLIFKYVFFFLKYFTIIIGAISKTTSVLKLSQDPSAKNIKYQIKIK